MDLGNLWAYFAQVYDVLLPPEPFLPTFQDFLQGLSASRVAVVPYPGQAVLQARNLICWTFCSHVASALPGFLAGLAYRVPMLVSLEVNYSGVRKFVRFFQVCNQANEHSVIFPVPNGAAHQVFVEQLEYLHCSLVKPQQPPPLGPLGYAGVCLFPVAA